MLSRLYRLEIDASVRSRAAGLTEPALRSLDAIHLATALQLSESAESFEAFVTYDTRLLAAAAAVGLPVSEPGN